MPLSEYYSSCGLVAVALVALLLLPSDYLVSEQQAAPAAPAPPRAAPPQLRAWSELASAHIPPLDLVFTFALIALTFVIYLFEWIQRKIMERRVVKLNQYLGSNLERLQAWDGRQEQVEATLRLVQHATAEYNLLLYLLVRQHRGQSAAANAQPSDCFFDRAHEDDFAFLKSPLVDTPL